jgi:hypothetical protein
MLTPNYRIAQYEKYIGHDRWKWSAWIEGSTEDLDLIECVTWILHPTFSPSRVERRTRENNFRLDTSGWGTFVLRAQLHRKDQDDTQVIRRTLKLTYPDDGPPGTAEEPNAPASFTQQSEANKPTVFLSYSSEDAQQALQVRRGIERLGVRILEANTIAPSLPLEAAIRKMIRESDAVLSVVGSDYISPSVVFEMKTAQAEEKPVVTVLPDDGTWPSGLATDVASVRNTNDEASMMSALAPFVGRLISSP